nr:PREDICTED: vacuolar protein sorting-associated protein 41 homolog isoform X1 [Musa acuminata subsp. malaccensis]
MASDDPLDNGIDGDDERKEDDDAEEEPRLKYQRLVGSVPSLLSNDAAASIAVAERMIALGTHDGTVHILDFQGNQGLVGLCFLQYMVHRPEASAPVGVSKRGPGGHRWLSKVVQ